MAVIKRGGQLTKGGTYFNLRSWEFITVAKPQGNLPGSEGQPYFRVPVALVLMLGPILGLFFVVLLPLAGLLAIPVALGRGVYLLTRRLGRALFPAAATAPASRHGKAD